MSVMCRTDLRAQRGVRQSQGACSSSVRRTRPHDDVAAVLPRPLRSTLQSLDRRRRRLRRWPPSCHLHREFMITSLTPACFLSHHHLHSAVSSASASLAVPIPPVAFLHFRCSGWFLLTLLYRSFFLCR